MIDLDLFVRWSCDSLVGRNRWFEPLDLYDVGGWGVLGGVRDQRKNLSHKSNDFLTIFERGAYVTKKQQ